MLTRRYGQLMCTPKGRFLQPLPSSTTLQCSWQMMSAAMPWHVSRCVSQPHQPALMPELAAKVSGCDSGSPRFKVQVPVVIAHTHRGALSSVRPFYPGAHVDTNHDCFDAVVSS